MNFKKGFFLDPIHSFLSCTFIVRTFSSVYYLHHTTLSWHYIALCCCLFLFLPKWFWFLRYSSRYLLYWHTEHIMIIFF